MKTTRIIAVGLGTLLLSGCLAGNVHAAELCHAATPQFLIAWYQQTHPQSPLHYDPKNSAIYHPVATLITASPHVNWIGLAWLSPVWGAVFATDCDGKPLAAMSNGAVGKLSAGPDLPDLGQTVMVEYVDRETADCVHDSIAILAFSNGRIVSLWTHESKQGMNLAGRHSAFHGFISRKFTPRFTDQGQSISVTGELAAYPFLKDGTQSTQPSATRSLATELYRWDAKTLRFAPEGKYTQFKTCIRTDWPSRK